MQQPPKISVIIPSYDHEKFIGEAVQSVLDQTFTDFELLIIDDKSKDNTLEILNQFDDHRIVIHVNRKNIGSTHTINKGLKYARGKYIAILNSDDVYKPKRLERCLQECETTGNLLTGTDIRLIDEVSDEIDNRLHWWIEWYECMKNNYFDSKDLLQTLLSGNLFISTSNFFFKKDIISTIGFFQNMTFVQDYDYLLKIFATFGQKISWIPEKLLHYRLHQSNTIRSNALESNRETLKILLRWLPEYTGNPQMKAKLATFTKHIATISGHIENALEESIHQKFQKNETRLYNELDKTHKNWEKDVQKLQAELDKTHKNWEKDVQKLQAKLDKTHKNWAEDTNLRQTELDKTHQNWQRDVKNFQLEIEDIHEQWQQNAANLNEQLSNQNETLIKIKQQWIDETAKLHEILLSRSKELQIERDYFTKEKNELLTIIEEKTKIIEELTALLNRSKMNIFQKFAR